MEHEKNRRKKQEYFAYVGNWGVGPKREGYGFSVCVYDSETGSLTPIGSCAKQIHVGAVYPDLKRGVLYCVDEDRNLEEQPKGTPGGRVYALKMDPETGFLKELSCQPTLAPLPSCCMQDASGAYLLVSNHCCGLATRVMRDSSGKFCAEVVGSDTPTVAYPLAEDGSIGEACSIYMHLPARDPETGMHMPHPHSVIRANDGEHLFVCDKGTAQICSLALREGQLQYVGRQEVPAGSAPRYGCVHPEKPWLFVNYEELPEVSSLEYAADGTLTLLDSVSILPEDSAWTKRQQSSDIRLHPDGRHLYNVLRGSNIVTVLEVDPDTGGLTRVQTVHFEATDFCGGGARGLTLSPDQRFLFVCVADDGDVHRFALREDGLLQEEDTVTHIGNAANLTFVPV